MQAVAPAPGGPKEAINCLAVLKANIKIKNPRIRAGIGPKPTISFGKWQSGPSPGTPRAKVKIKNHSKHTQDYDFGVGSSFSVSKLRSKRGPATFP